MEVNVTTSTRIQTLCANSSEKSQNSHLTTMFSDNGKLSNKYKMLTLFLVTSEMSATLGLRIVQ